MLGNYCYARAVSLQAQNAKWVTFFGLHGRCRKGQSLRFLSIQRFVLPNERIEFGCRLQLWPAVQCFMNQRPAAQTAPCLAIANKMVAAAAAHPACRRLTCACRSLQRQPPCSAIARSAGAWNACRPARRPAHSCAIAVCWCDTSWRRANCWLHQHDLSCRRGRYRHNRRAHLQRHAPWRLLRQLHGQRQVLHLHRLPHPPAADADLCCVRWRRPCRRCHRRRRCR